MTYGDAKEQVRQATDIVDLVGKHLELRRPGRGYVGRCPWHDDRKPSLQVNPDRQTWKCWVCDIGGDVFSFVMKREGCDFREALQMLADRAGITARPAAASESRARQPGRQEHALSVLRLGREAVSRIPAASRQRPRSPASTSKSGTSRRPASSDSTSAFRPTNGPGCSTGPGTRRIRRKCSKPSACSARASDGRTITTASKAA